MMMCQKEVHSSLLIGCTKRVVELTDQDHMKVSTSVSLPRTEVSTVASITFCLTAEACLACSIQSARVRQVAFAFFTV